MAIKGTSGTRVLVTGWDGGGESVIDEAIMCDGTDWAVHSIGVDEFHYVIDEVLGGLGRC